MNAYFSFLSALCIGCLCNTSAVSSPGEYSSSNVSFYTTPLVCGAAPEIGCGSRSKPLLVKLEEQEEIDEAWLNRPGTIIAVVWNKQGSSPGSRSSLTASLFKQFEIRGNLVTDQVQHKDAFKSFSKKGKWYRGSDVDELSIEEAGVIAETSIRYARDTKLLNKKEAKEVATEIETYFKTELVAVSTKDELFSNQDKWHDHIYEIYEKHIGKKRTETVRKLFNERRSAESRKASCCDPKKSKKGRSKNEIN